MKKRLERLLNQEDGVMTLNTISKLHRWQIDPVTQIKVDRLELAFSTMNDARIFGGRYEIEARDPDGIIEEICHRTSEYLFTRAEALNSDIRAGYTSWEG